MSQFGQGCTSLAPTRFSSDVFVVALGVVNRLRHPVAALAALALACGSPRPAPEASPTETSAPATAAPTCQLAIGEYVFRVAFHNKTEVRDSLVGECVDRGWSRTERECVASADGAVSLAECVTTNTRMVAANLGGEGAVGIAECDRAIANYRRCIVSVLPVTLASDTEQALDITIAAWRKRMADNENGWLEVQLECSALGTSLGPTLTRYGCQRD